MARTSRKNGPTKADHIRAELKANPRVKPSEVVRILSDKGIKVLANHVYALKAHAKVRKNKQRRTAAGEAAVQAGLANPIQAVVEVRMLAMKLGGIKNLKRLVDLLAE